MKKEVVILSLLLAFIGIGHQQAFAGYSRPSLQDTTRIYSLQEVDQIPKFVLQKPSKKAVAEEEGDKELYMFLTRNFRYPGDAARVKAQGELIASFVIDRAGNLSDIKMLNSVHHRLDEELMRVIKTTKGKWKPALKNGNPVSVTYILPYRIRFL